MISYELRQLFIWSYWTKLITTLLDIAFRLSTIEFIAKYFAFQYGSVRQMLDGGLADENFLEQLPVPTMTLSAQWLFNALHSNTELH